MAEWRKARAVELATQGHTYQQIADELGYANRGTVHRLVQQTLHAHQADSVDTLRALEVARIGPACRTLGAQPNRVRPTLGQPRSGVSKPVQAPGHA